MNKELKRKIAFALLMGAVTTGIISFSLIGLNIGFPGGFALIWLRSWAFAYAISIPVILFFGPRIQSLVERLVPARRG